jgi:hypothetical protein
MKRKPKPSSASAASVVRTTLRMPAPLWTRLKHFVVDRNSNLQTVINQAVERYLDKEEK